MGRTRRSSGDDMTVQQRVTFACQSGSLTTLKRIVDEEYKGDINQLNTADLDDSRLQMPLHVASRYGKKEIVEYLIQKGVDVHVQLMAGATPLYLAAQEGWPDIMNMLLEAKSDINSLSSSDLMTPLSATVDGFGTSTIRDQVKCLSILLEKNADASLQTIYGETPVFLAALMGFVEGLQLLLSHNSKLVNTPDKFGWTPIAAAREKGYEECVNVLLAAGADDLGPPQFPINVNFFREKATNEIQDVDEMKIQTMYKMVDECTVITQGKEVVKKVLYLTNKQAVMFDEDAMERAVQALDIGDPKFVIKLLPALGMGSQMRLAHPEDALLPGVQFLKSNTVGSEIAKADERAVETQLLLFMKSCILPLAMQTRALILVSGSNDCYISAALAKIAVAEQARLGKECPFTVLATVSAIEIHQKAISQSPNDQLCIASQIARQASAWQKRIVFMNEVYSKIMLPKREDLQGCDLTEAAQRYIIFEGFEEGVDGHGTLNRGPQKLFESIFLQHMTRKLPSIAIQCLDTPEDTGVPFLVDLTSRNIPVLLLDCTERCFTSSKFDAKSGPLTKLAKLSDAFPLITEEINKQITVEDGSISHEGKSILIELACEMIERKMAVMAEHATVDCLTISLLAFFHSVLTLDNEAMSEAGYVPLHARIKELEKIERTSKDLKKALVSPELANKVMDFIFSRVSALEAECILCKIERWMKHIPKDAKHLKHLAVESRIFYDKQIEEIESNAGLLTNYDLDHNKWLAYYDLLTSTNTFSGSIFDIDEVKRILGSVAKIDRLPNANTLEALRTLQDSWDHVELYNMVADSYKSIAKQTYVALLLVGIVITTFSILHHTNFLRYQCSNSVPLLIDDSVFNTRYVVIFSSFIGTIIASYVAYTNPAIKWQQLRTAALSIESNIWTFRTRAGPYRTTGEGFDQTAEKLLSDVVRDIKEKVLEGADIKNTAFYSRIQSQNKHGQHPPNFNTFGAIDNFTRLMKQQIISAEDSKANAKHAPVIGSIMEMLTPKKSTGNNPSDVKTKTPVDTKALTMKNLKAMSATKRDSISKTLTLGDDDELKDIDDNRYSEEVTEKSFPLVDFISKLKRDDNELDNNNIDSHYEPLQPDAYIQFRVLPVIYFYKNRIPQCNNIRNVTQFLLVLGSLGAAVLSMLNLTEYASGISIMTASITAYLEFSGTNSKINRYSNTVHSLSELINWWQTLTAIDRSVVSNIDRLVLTCEDLLLKERQAWRSTSQSVRMLQKKSEHNKD